MEIIASLALIVALISIYYWNKYRERDVFGLMILGVAALILKGWRIIEGKYVNLSDLMQRITLATRLILSFAIVSVIIKILFFNKEKK